MKLYRNVLAKRLNMPSPCLLTAYVIMGLEAGKVSQSLWKSYHFNPFQTHSSRDSGDIRRYSFICPPYVQKAVGFSKLVIELGHRRTCLRSNTINKKVYPDGRLAKILQWKCCSENPIPTNITRSNMLQKGSNRMSWRTASPSHSILFLGHQLLPLSCCEAVSSNFIYSACLPQHDPTWEMPKLKHIVFN